VYTSSAARQASAAFSRRAAQIQALDRLAERDLVIAAHLALAR
jgi:hypothetical protein